MHEEIKELYKKLYNQNQKILKEKKDILLEKFKEENAIRIENNLRKKRFRLGIILFRLLIPFFILVWLRYCIINGGTLELMEVYTNLLDIILNITIVVIVLTFFVFCYQILKKEEPDDKSLSQALDEYNNVFSETLCKTIIEKFFTEAQYDYRDGISEEVYLNMGFPNVHETYESNNLIKLNNKIMLSKICTEFDYGYQKLTLFSGAVSIQKFEFDFPFEVKIRNKNSKSLKFENHVVIDENEFFSYYEIDIKHKELFNKYFNSSLLKYLTNLAISGINCEINILHNEMYIRIENEDFFNFNILRDDDVKVLITTCETIALMKDINTFILKEFNK